MSKCDRYIRYRKDRYGHLQLVRANRVIAGDKVCGGQLVVESTYERDYYEDRETYDFEYVSVYCSLCGAEHRRYDMYDLEILVRQAEGL